MKKESLVKKEYKKPKMRQIKLKQQSALLCSSDCNDDEVNPDFND